MTRPRTMPTAPRSRSSAWMVGLAAALLGAGCLLADPRPSPGSDSGIQSYSDAGPLDIDSASSDAALPPGAVLDADKIHVSGAGASDTDVAVVGETGSAPADTLLQVANMTSGATPVDVTSTPSGEFVAVLTGQVGDMIVVSVFDGTTGLMLDSAAAGVGDFAALAAVGDPDDMDGMLEFSTALVTIVDNGDGTVTVVGAVGATGPDLLVVAGNQDTLATATTVAAADGSFSVTLGGAMGDTLVLFAVDPLAGSSSQTQIVVVP